MSIKENLKSFFFLTIKILKREISKQSNNSIGILIIINFGGRLNGLVGYLFMALSCCSDTWSCD